MGAGTPPSESQAVGETLNASGQGCMLDKGHAECNREDGASVPG